MSRAAELHATVGRCKNRLQFAQKRFDQFCSKFTFTPRNPDAVRQHRALAAELERARSYLAWAEMQLSRVREVAGMNL